MNKPTIQQIINELMAAGATPDTPYEELSPEARAIFIKHINTIMAHMGPPPPGFIDNIMDKGIAFPG